VPHPIAAGNRLEGRDCQRWRFVPSRQRQRSCPWLAALIYQHQAQGADKALTNAIDTHVQAEQTRRANDEDGPADVLVPAG
jgi:hypothetical protein